MGIMADGVTAYAQVLIDQTDGSMKQVNHALATSQLCWNLALTPDDEREAAINEMLLDLGLENEEYKVFRGIVVGMIVRHKEMFPLMHTHNSKQTPDKVVKSTPPPKALKPIINLKTTERNAPCPCNSGRKFKQCCGK